MIRNFFNRTRNQFGNNNVRKQNGKVLFSQVILALEIIISWVLANLLTNLLQVFIYSSQTGNVGNISSLISANVSTFGMYFHSFNLVSWLHILKWIIFLIALIFFIGRYAIYISYRNAGNNGEYGSARLATMHEMRQQTYEVPDRIKSYTESPGLIISHYYNVPGIINNGVKRRLSKLKENIKLGDNQDYEYAKAFTIVWGSILLAIIFILFLITSVAIGFVPAILRFDTILVLLLLFISIFAIPILSYMKFGILKMCGIIVLSIVLLVLLIKFGLLKILVNIIIVSSLIYLFYWFYKKKSS